jgi:hypothetical protein
MKTVLLTLVMVFLSSVVHAKVIEITVPDDTFTYDNISINFDGSVSIDNPKVYANGEYLPFINSTYGYTRTASIACVLFGFSGSGASLTDRQASDEDGDLVAHLGYTKEKGIFLAGIYETSSKQDVVIHLSCKQKKKK